MPNRLDLARLRNILSAANEIGGAPVDLSIIDVTGDSRMVAPVRSSWRLPALPTTAIGPSPTPSNAGQSPSWALRLCKNWPASASFPLYPTFKLRIAA